MRRAAFFFAVLFLLAALLQWNDPDPAIWMAGYGLAAALSALAAAGRRLLLANVIAALIFGLWFASLAPSLLGADPAAFQSFQMRAPGHEEPREALGLALCAGWSLVLAWAARREQENEASEPPSAD